MSYLPSVPSFPTDENEKLSGNLRLEQGPTVFSMTQHKPSDSTAAVPKKPCNHRPPLDVSRPNGQQKLSLLTNIDGFQVSVSDFPVSASSQPPLVLASNSAPPTERSNLPTTASVQGDPYSESPLTRYKEQSHGKLRLPDPDASTLVQESSPVETASPFLAIPTKTPRNSIVECKQSMAVMSPLESPLMAQATSYLSAAMEAREPVQEAAPSSEKQKPPTHSQPSFDNDPAQADTAHRNTIHTSTAWRNDNNDDNETLQSFVTAAQDFCDWKREQVQQSPFRQQSTTTTTTTPPAGRSVTNNDHDLTSQSPSWNHAGSDMALHGGSINDASPTTSPWWNAKNDIDCILLNAVTLQDGSPLSQLTTNDAMEYDDSPTFNLSRSVRSQSFRRSDASDLMETDVSLRRTPQMTPSNTHNDSFYLETPKSITELSDASSVSRLVELSPFMVHSAGRTSLGHRRQSRRLDRMTLRLPTPPSSLRKELPEENVADATSTAVEPVWSPLVGEQLMLEKDSSVAGDEMPSSGLPADDSEPSSTLLCSSGTSSPDQLTASHLEATEIEETPPHSDDPSDNDETNIQCQVYSPDQSIIYSGPTTLATFKDRTILPPILEDVAVYSVDSQSIESMTKVQELEALVAQLCFDKRVVEAKLNAVMQAHDDRATPFRDAFEEGRRIRMRYEKELQETKERHAAELQEALELTSMVTNKLGKAVVQIQTLRAEKATLKEALAEAQRDAMASQPSDDDRNPETVAH